MAQRFAPMRSTGRVVSIPDNMGYEMYNKVWKTRNKAMGI